jgi:hypothetical protein
VIFSAPVSTGPGSHPAPCTNNIQSFPGVKWSALDVNHPLLSGPEVEERGELYLYSPLCFNCRFRVNFCKFAKLVTRGTHITEEFGSSLGTAYRLLTTEVL